MYFGATVFFIVPLTSFYFFLNLIGGLNTTFTGPYLHAPEILVHPGCRLPLGPGATPPPPHFFTGGPTGKGHAGGGGEAKPPFLLVLILAIVLSPSPLIR